MGNKQKVGGRRSVFRKRKGGNLPNMPRPSHKVAESESQTPAQSRPTLSRPSSSGTSKATSSRKYKVEGNFDYYTNKSEVLDYDIVDLNLLYYSKRLQN